MITEMFVDRGCLDPDVYRGVPVEVSSAGGCVIKLDPGDSGSVRVTTNGDVGCDDFRCAVRSVMKRKESLDLVRQGDPDDEDDPVMNRVFIEGKSTNTAVMLAVSAYFAINERTGQGPQRCLVAGYDREGGCDLAAVRLSVQELIDLARHIWGFGIKVHAVVPDVEEA